MGNKSIAYSLSLFISLAIIAVYLVFIILAYRDNRKLLTENIEAKAFAMGDNIISAVRVKVVSTEEITRNMVELMPFYARENKIEELVLPFFKKYSFLHSIHVNFQNNTFPLGFTNLKFTRANDSVTILKDGHLSGCYAEKKSQEMLLQDQTSGWSEPYRCNDESVPLSSYLYRFTINDPETRRKASGWISSELSLHFLTQEISNIELSKKAFVMIVSKKGTYISHPVESKIFYNNLFNVSKREVLADTLAIRKILENQEKGSFIVYPEIFNFQKSNVYFKPVKENGWMIFFVYHHAELFRNLRIILAKMIFLSIIGVLVVLGLIHSITRRLIKPIKHVAAELENFSRNDKDYIHSVRNEAEALNRSLDRLKTKYQKIIELQEIHGIENGKITDDLIQASEIQKSIIKTSYPAFPDRQDIDIHSVFQPARLISGDLYDYFFLDSTNLLFAIGDVSGKGIPAALFMSVAHTLLRADLSGMKPSQIVSRLNNELCSTNQHHLFLTFFVGILNTENGELWYCNAGHTSTVIRKTDGSIEELTVSHGLPLGVYSDRHYDNSSTVVSGNSILLLYTDGVTETLGTEGKHYGTERLKEILKSHDGDSVISLNEAIVADLDRFRGSTRPTDDICLLTLKFNG